MKQIVGQKHLLYTGYVLLKSQLIEQVAVVPIMA